LEFTYRLRSYAVAMDGVNESSAAAAVETSTRRFPELPRNHPLWTLEMTPENGSQWIDNPFASDACLVVQRRFFFIHRPYVEGESKFLKNLLEGSDCSSSDNFNQQLDPDVVDPEVCASLLRWMYTKDEPLLHKGNVFGTIPVADFFGMSTAFWEVLYATISRIWRSSLDTDWLASMAKVRRLPFMRGMDVLQKCEDTSAIPADVKFDILLSFSDVVDGEPLERLKGEVRQLVLACSHQALQSARTSRSVAFDALIPASLLWDWKSSQKSFKMKCANCSLVFNSSDDVEKVTCYKDVNVHGEATYISSRGNTVCRNCNQLVTKHVNCRKRVKLTHDLRQHLEFSGLPLGLS